MSHPLKVCVFTEADFTNKLDPAEFNRMENVDLMCEQLYMDRIGLGVNGVRVTRKRK